VRQITVPKKADAFTSDVDIDLGDLAQYF